MAFLTVVFQASFNAGRAVRHHIQLNGGILCKIMSWDLLDNIVTFLKMACQKISNSSPAAVFQTIRYLYGEVT